MKLVFLVVGLIVVIAVDCLAQTLEPPAPPLIYSPLTDPDTRMENEGDSEDDGAFERATCSLRRDCAFWGGQCTTSTTTCLNSGGRVVVKGCKGTGCYCCIPGCNQKYGFFSVGDQCFKLDKRREVSYSLAKTACQGLGLKLAHPQDAVALRSSLMQLYGLADEVWLFAQGTGSQFVWGDGYALRNTSALWAPRQPRSTSSSYCLALATYDYQWTRYPNQTFYAQSCTIPEYPVCETM